MTVERKTERREIELNGYGELTVISGAMFSGKTSELIDTIDNEFFSGRSGIIIKPSNDTRYKAGKVTTHSGRELDAYTINNREPELILELVEELVSRGEKVDTIGIDEAQFFNKEKLPLVVEELLYRGKDVIAAGLATDFRNEPFGAMGDLLAKAETRIEKFARCTYKDPNGKVCGDKRATRTQRIINGKPADWESEVVVVGGDELYEARCKKHHQIERPAYEILIKKAESTSDE